MFSTILIIDDDPLNHEILAGMLADLCTIKSVDSAKEALEIITNGLRPDLILLDVEMPEMDGYELLKQLKQQNITKDMPVIFVTGQDDVQSEEYGLTLGAADYIRKPLNYIITRSRVTTHLENKKANDFLNDHNAVLESEVQKRIFDNEIIQHVSLSALAMVAETRDQETGNHILRTQKYVEILCNDLQTNSVYAIELSNDEVKRIVKVAPLHDIGKVGIPDHILHKPGKFEPDEWEIMKTHAEIGGMALEKSIENVLNSELGKCNQGSFMHAVEFLEIGVRIARHHHERWDGKGYPCGLSGIDIPLPARIMAIADVFDALSSKRCYKEPYSSEQTLSVIRQGRGTQFDPEILDSFERVYDTMYTISRQYSDLVEG